MLLVNAAQLGDPLRINLKFPPDQYMYVKATTASERQQWLVALGSSKACLTQGNTPERTKKDHHGEYFCMITWLTKYVKILGLLCLRFLLYYMSVPVRNCYWADFS